jgi:hypothetical protein
MTCTFFLKRKKGTQKIAFSGNMESGFWIWASSSLPAEADKVTLFFLWEPEIFVLAPPTEDFRKNPEVGAFV